MSSRLKRLERMQADKSKDYTYKVYERLDTGEVIDFKTKEVVEANDIKHNAIFISFI